MEENKNSVFRQKSLERVSSPEQLDTYLKITSVNVWFILIAIILLLVGAIVWATVGTIESSVSSGCIVSGGKINCYLGEKEASKIKEDMSITINDEDYSISSINLYGLYQNGSSDKAISISGASEGEYVYELTASGDIKDGSYKGKIVTEEISPLVFVFN